jgi:autotransporter-associated beta strand protein
LDEEQYLSGGDLILKGATVEIMDHDLRVQGGTVAVNASPLPSQIGGAGSVTLFGDTTFNVGNGVQPVDFTISVPIGNSGTRSVIKSGAGTMGLTEAATYAGATTVSAGTLSLLGGPNTLPTTTTLSVSSGASLTLNNNAQSVSGLSGSGTIQLGYGALTVNPASAFSFGGIITGSPAGNIGDNSNPGGLTKLGAGQLTITANQTYTGDTLINAGTLALSGSGGMTASSNIVVTSTLDVTARTGGSMTLANGQTLKGNGTVTGGIQVGNGSTVAPGQSIGTLATGAETWFGNGSYQWEISHATNPGSWDALNINGGLTIASSSANKFNIKLVSPGGALAGFNNASNYTWIIATATGGISSFDPTKFNIDPSGLGVDLGGGTFAVQQQGNNLMLAFNAFIAPPAVPALITNVAVLGNGTVSVSGTGGVNQPYILQGATNLNPPVGWTSILTNSASSNGILNFTDTQATNLGSRFYRLSTP